MSDGQRRIISNTPKIKFRGVHEKEWKEHEVEEGKPLTLICHKGDIRVKPDENMIELTPEYTVYHGQRVVKIDRLAREWAEHILGYALEECEPSERAMSEAHIIGLCDLPVKLMQKCGHALPFFIREPETYLHPSQQSKVADWMAAMTKIGPDGVFNINPPQK